MDSTDDFSDWIYHYGSLYGPQIVLLATLSAITIYRREMSCNHCYASRPSTTNNNNTNSNNEVSSQRTTREWDDIEAENLLDGVGLYCSGASLMPVVMHLLCVWKETQLCASSEMTTEEILEHAGNFLSCEPLTTALLGPASLKNRVPATMTTLGFASSRTLAPSPSLQSLSGLSSPSSASSASCLLNHYELFAGFLPPDLQIHVCSFLHPRDVVHFGSINRACRATVDQQPTLWKALFLRDYAWAVTAWDVGRQALERSAITTLSSIDIVYNKELYFRFGLAFIDYLLAGQNTAQRCLVGIGGHVYDLTPFLMSHPGSPETVLVSAGRDATQFFANVGHSTGALRLAKSMCVLVDGTQSAAAGGGAGLFPTRHVDLQDPNDPSITVPAAVQADLMDVQELRANATSTSSSSSSSTSRNGSIGDNGPTLSRQTLHYVRQAFITERLAAEARVRRSAHARQARLTDLNVYYDPFVRTWKAWYTNPQMEPVFVDAV